MSSAKFLDTFTYVYSLLCYHILFFIQMLNIKILSQRADTYREKPLNLHIKVCLQAVWGTAVYSI